jgi:hypothetical protein
MNTSRNKPRVFLSHSKHDITFVQRIYDDLRHCLIEPWLDSEEIRHGQPWLEAIFEAGIPTCDCVLVYLTPSSVESALVKKEIDASIISKLRDNQIAFLPYVSNSELRVKLRPDIQALQTPEWNDANYHSLLPRVVSEVWHSFMERTVLDAIGREKVRRLEAELEVDRLKSKQAGPFAEAENLDFRYIWNTLDRWESVTFRQEIVPEDAKNRAFHYRRIELDPQPQRTSENFAQDVTVFVHVRSIVPFLAAAKEFEYRDASIPNALRLWIEPNLTPVGSKTRTELMDYPDFTEKLVMFGFVERRERPQSAQNTFLEQLYTLVYTQKIERFKYWLAFNEILPEEIKWSTERPAESTK